MPIDTTNEKLSLMELEQVYEPGLPLSPGGIAQDDQKQLLWGYPGLAWSDTAAQFEPAYDRIHANDLFIAPDHRWLFPTSMAAPEFTPYIRDETPDAEHCVVRRAERDDQCKRRADEDELALRRAPECPEELACSNQGCV